MHQVPRIPSALSNSCLASFKTSEYGFRTDSEGNQHKTPEEEVRPGPQVPRIPLALSYSCLASSKTPRVTILDRFLTKLTWNSRRRSRPGQQEHQVPRRPSAKCYSCSASSKTPKSQSWTHFHEYFPSYAQLFSDRKCGFQ